MPKPLPKLKLLVFGARGDMFRNKKSPHPAATGQGDK